MVVFSDLISKCVTMQISANMSSICCTDANLQSIRDIVEKFKGLHIQYIVTDK